jgi:hypothetical protein
MYFVACVLLMFGFANLCENKKQSAVDCRWKNTHCHDCFGQTIAAEQSNTSISPSAPGNQKEERDQAKHSYGTV